MADVTPAAPTLPGSDPAAPISEVLYRVGTSLSAELDGARLVQRVIDECVNACGARSGEFTPGGGDAAEAPPGALTVPVRTAGGEFLGSLVLRPVAGREFGEREARLARGIAEQAAVALHNARLLADAHRARELEARRARQASLGASIGAALTRPTEVSEVLKQCAEAVVRHLEAAFARIWTLDAAGTVLELKASAGMYTHLDGPHARVPVGAFKIGLIAQERKPHLTNDVLSDERVGNKPWAAREGMVAFAGYPLLVDDRLVGVLAMFSRARLSDDALDALGSVADIIALGIERRRADQALKAVHAERALLLAREQAARAEADAERTKLFDLFMQAPVPIAVWEGPEHRYALANPPYERMVNRPGLAGGTLRERFPELVGAPLFDILDRTYQTGEPFVTEEFHVRLDRRGDGTLDDGYFSFNLHPVRGVGGVITGLMAVAVEVTDRVLAGREREKLIALLERSNQELDQFAYVTSHDLKAPLRGISNLSQWLEEDLGDRVDEQAREHLRLLRGRVARMEALINGILDYSRAGRVREKLELLNTGRLLRDVTELLAPPASVSIRAVSEMPTFMAERVPLQQVLMNLLNNAIKHARREDAVIEVAAQRSGARWEFTVKDNGPGIAPEFHERIWGIFQTLEARDKVEGTGIGLSVVKKIVESRGGRVWVDSAPGRGATFGFDWPADDRAPGR